MNMKNEAPMAKPEDLTLSSFTPEDGEKYWTPDPTSPALVSFSYYRSMGLASKHRSEHGLCYPFTSQGKNAATLHSSAMLMTLGGAHA